jgi:hypothetical protein
MILSASSPALLQQLVKQLQSSFAVKDMGDLRYFLGVEVQRSAHRFFLSQSKYTHEVLERTGMANCKPVSTPADTKPKISCDDSTTLRDVSWYRAMAGALQYLTLMRPDIAYAVQQVCLHMHAPCDMHLVLLKRVLRYLKGTTTHGLQLHRAKTPTITAYSNADWAGCPDTRRSMSDFCMFLGDSLVSWSSKHQTMVSRSSAKAEYRGVTNAVAECTWLRDLLGELHCDVSTATIADCDNISSVYMSRNPVHHKHEAHRTGHSFRSGEGDPRQASRSTGTQRSSICRCLHQGASTSLFQDFRSSLCVTTSTVNTGVGVGGGVGNGFPSPARAVVLALDAHALHAPRSPRRARG